jgi:hypothetical protein
MAIKYLDAKRIRGSSTSAVVPTHDIDYSSNSGWTQVNGDGSHANITISNGKVEAGTGTDASTTNAVEMGTAYVHYNLTNDLSDTTWTVDFDFKFIDGTTNVHVVPFALAETTAKVVSDVTHTSIEFQVYDAGSNTYRPRFLCFDNTDTRNFSVDYGTALAEGTQYYIRLQRLNSTSCTLAIYTNSARTTLLGSAVTLTLPSTLNDLQYLQHCSSPSASSSATYGIWEVDNTKIYDGSAADSFITDEKATFLTSVYPDGLGSATDGANGGGTAITIETDTSVPSGLDTDTCWSGTAADNRITLGTSGQPLTAGTNDYTVAFWFKLDNNTQTQEIVRWGVSGSTIIEAFHYATGAFACQGATHTGLSASTWYHGAIVRDGSNGILYLDGVADSTTSTLPVVPTVNNDNTSCNLMGRKVENEGMTGNMKEVGFWNRALSSAEITSLVGNKTSTAKKVTEVSTTGLTTYFSCDTIAPNIADSSTNSSDLPENTLFEETDTYSQWWLQSSKWKGVNQPLAISDLWAWWKAESKYMTLNGSGVTAWNPQINTTPKKLIADSAGVEPTFEAAGRNGRGIVKFDGTEVMHTNDDSHRLTQPLTFVIVMKFPTAVDDKTIFDADNTGNRLLHRNTGTAGTQLEMNNGAVFTSTATTQFSASWGYEVLVFNGSSSKWRINGVDVKPSTFNPSTDINPLTIASDYRALNGGSNNAVMDFMHFIIYDKALSDSEITDIEEWCASEVGT